MMPAEVYAATLREISIVVKGALWRQQHAARLSLREAWYMAALSGAATAGKLPSLESLMDDSVSSRATQTPDEVRLNVMAWAAVAGLKVHHRTEQVTRG
jgi:hypothetical protein